MKLFILGMLLGLFDTVEEASPAYQAAKARLHPFWHQNDGLEFGS